MDDFNVMGWYVTLGFWYLGRESVVIIVITIARPLTCGLLSPSKTGRMEMLAENLMQEELSSYTILSINNRLLLPSARVLQKVLGAPLILVREYVPEEIVGHSDDSCSIVVVPTPYGGNKLIASMLGVAKRNWMERTIQAAVVNVGSKTVRII